MIHPLSDVQSTNIGELTNIWQYVVVLKGASIGRNCNICSHCFIEDDVQVGNNVTIKNGVYLWNGLRVEDDVFIGPAVAFTNDIYPRSKHRATPVATIIKKGVSLGANASVRCGITIGEYAMAGIGAVITKDVPAYALVMGNPARVKGWVDEQGIKLTSAGEKKWKSAGGLLYEETVHGLKRV